MGLPLTTVAAARDAIKRCVSYTNLDVDKIEIYLVTRAYQVRHGPGPLVNEHLAESSQISFTDETNVPTLLRGPLRKAVLDLDILHYAIDMDKGINQLIDNVILVITCLDHITGQYRLTSLGKLCEYQTESEFVNVIACSLGINQVLLSHSPNSQFLKV